MGKKVSNLLNHPVLVAAKVQLQFCLHDRTHFSIHVVLDKSHTSVDSI